MDNTACPAPGPTDVDAVHKATTQLQRIELDVARVEERLRGLPHRLRYALALAAGFRALARPAAWERWRRLRTFLGSVAYACSGQSESLTRALMACDGVLSAGSEAVRRRRKALVRRVQAALEEADRLRGEANEVLSMHLRLEAEARAGTAASAASGGEGKGCGADREGGADCRGGAPPAGPQGLPALELAAGPDSSEEDARRRVVPDADCEEEDEEEEGEGEEEEEEEGAEVEDGDDEDDDNDDADADDDEEEEEEEEGGVARPSDVTIEEKAGAPAVALPARRAEEDDESDAEDEGSDAAGAGELAAPARVADPAARGPGGAGVVPVPLEALPRWEPEVRTVDLRHREGVVVAQVDLRGVAPEDVRAGVEDGGRTLRLSGVRYPTRAEWARFCAARQRGWGAQRAPFGVFDLPLDLRGAGVDAARVSARWRGGMLELSLPVARRPPVVRHAGPWGSSPRGALGAGYPFASPFGAAVGAWPHRWGHGALPLGFGW